MKYGYIRVASSDESCVIQEQALAKCDSIYKEIATGTKTERPVLTELIEQLQIGDELIVWRLDRLGKSTNHLISTVIAFKERGVRFISIDEGIDTDKEGNFFSFIGNLQNFEKEILNERTRKGLRKAWSADKKGGRSKLLTNEEAEEIAMEVLSSSHSSVGSVIQNYQIPRATYYRNVHPIVQRLRESNLQKS